MTDPAIREPEQIRQDCARKLRVVDTSAMFTAILACLLDEDWTDPKIEQLAMTYDRCLLARAEGDCGFDKFFAKAAGLDGDELGYLLGKIADLKGPK